MRSLDEVADALQSARGGRLPRTVHSATRLEDQFDTPITAAHWVTLQRRLGCPLPPLEFDQGHWWLPPELVTVWDLAAHVARHRPDRAPPTEQTPGAWREAQVFVGVREVLSEVGNLDPEAIVRSARLRTDLGLW